MAAGTSLICDTTILSDCSYRIYSIWALFFDEISSISSSVPCFVRELRGVETSRKYDTTFAYKSKQINVFYDIICPLFLGDNPGSFFFRDVLKHGC